jgi:hypothetical protein
MSVFIGMNWLLKSNQGLDKGNPPKTLALGTEIGINVFCKKWLLSGEANR